MRQKGRRINSCGKKSDSDLFTGLQLGDITPIANAGQLNAFITLNLKKDKRIALGFPRSSSAPTPVPIPQSSGCAGPRSRAGRRVCSHRQAGLPSSRYSIRHNGIPFAIKDLFDTFDMRTTADAAAAYGDDRPPRDSTAIAKLRSAGAIILGKTNLDEYAPAAIGRAHLAARHVTPTTRREFPGDRAEDPQFPSAPPDPIDHIVAIFFDHKNCSRPGRAAPICAMIAGQRRGEEGKYSAKRAWALCCKRLKFRLVSENVRYRQTPRFDSRARVY